MCKHFSLRYVVYANTNYNKESFRLPVEFLVKGMSHPIPRKERLRNVSGDEAASNFF
jgi:hypothetical protein